MKKGKIILISVLSVILIGILIIFIWMIVDKESRHAYFTDDSRTQIEYQGKIFRYTENDIDSGYINDDAHSFGTRYFVTDKGVFVLWAESNGNEFDVANGVRDDPTILLVHGSDANSVRGYFIREDKYDEICNTNDP